MIKYTPLVFQGCVILLLILCTISSSSTTLLLLAQTTIDITSRTSLSSETLSSGSKIIGTVQDNKNFVISDLVGTAIEIDVSLGNQSSIVCTGCIINGGLRMSVLQNVTEDQLSATSSSSFSKLSSLASSNVVFRGSRITCQSDQFCAGVNSDGMKFAFLFQLKPVTLKSASPSPTTLNIPVTMMPEITLALDDTVVKMTDTGANGYVSRKVTPAVGAFSVQLENSQSSYNIDRTKYQQTIFERTKLGLDTGDQISAIPISSSTTASDTNPPSHISLLITKGSNLELELSRVSSSDAPPWICSVISIAPSLPTGTPRTPVQTAEIGDGWNTTIDAAEDLISDKSYSYRPYNDESSMDFIRENGNSFSYLKFFLKSFIVADGSIIKLSARVQANFHASLVTSVLISHVIADKIIFRTNTQLETSTNLRVIGVFISEVHGGALPWLKSVVVPAITTTTTTMSSSNSSSNNNSSNPNDQFILPPVIFDLLPSVIVNQAILTLEQTKEDASGQECSQFSFVVADMNNFIFRDNKFTGKADAATVKLYEFLYLRQTDVITIEKQEIDVTMNLNPFNGYGGAVTFVNLFHTRDILLQNIRMNGYANETDLSLLSIQRIDHFWTIQVRNIVYNGTTGDQDHPALSIWRVENGKDIILDNISFLVKSGSTAQVCYFDDERVTNVERIIGNEFNGVMEVTGPINVFTLNSTMLNVSLVQFTNSKSVMKGSALNLLQASKTSTCFTLTVCQFGPRRIVVENITNEGDCILTGGIGLMAISEESNNHNMPNVESMTFRNLFVKSKGFASCAFILVLGAIQILDTAVDQVSYGYWVAANPFSPEAVVEVPLVIQNSTFSGSLTPGFPLSPIAAGIVLSNAILRNVTLQDFEMNLTQKVFVATMPQLPGFGKATGMVDVLNILPSAKVNSSTSKVEPCIKLDGVEIKSKEELDQYINSAYVRKVVGKECGLVSVTKSVSRTVSVKYITRTATNTSYYTRSTLTKSRSETPSASLPFAGYDTTVPPAAETIETVASMTGIAGGAGATTALEASRAIALISLMSRCASFQNADDQGKSFEQRQLEFVNTYFETPLKFPGSLLPFVCPPPATGNCVRGAVLADFIFIVLIFVLTTLHAKSLWKTGVEGMSPTERLATSIFNFGRYPFFVGMALAWRFGNWVTRTFVFLIAPGLPASDALFVGVGSLLLFIVLIGYTFRIFFLHVNKKEYDVLAQKNKEELKKKNSKNNRHTSQYEEDDDEEDFFAPSVSTSTKNNNSRTTTPRTATTTPRRGNNTNNTNNNIVTPRSRGSGSRNNNNNNHPTRSRSRHHNSRSPFSDEDEDAVSLFSENDLDADEQEMLDFFGPNSPTMTRSRRVRNNNSSSSPRQQQPQKKNKNKNTNRRKPGESPPSSARFLSSDEDEEDFLGSDPDGDEEMIDMYFNNNNNSNNRNRNRNRNSRNNNNNSTKTSGSNVNSRDLLSEHWLVEESMVSFAHLDEDEEEAMPKWIRWVRKTTIYLVNSWAGRFFAVGERVWSAERLNTKTNELETPPTANGKPPLQLWKVGGLLIKFWGPHVQERVLERRQTRKEYKEIKKIRDACGFSETASMGDVQTRRYFFIDWRLRLAPYYTFISFMWTFIATAANGAALANPGNCLASIYVIMTVNVLAFIFDFYLRPFLVPFRNIATVTASFFLAVSAISAVANGFNTESELFKFAETMVFLALSTQSIVAILQVMLKTSLVMCAGSVLLRRELWMKLQSLFAEDLPPAEMIRQAQKGARRGSNAAHTLVPADEILGLGVAL